MSKIIDILSKGQKNARTASDIARLLNCDVREVRAEIARLRKQGKIICASTTETSAGYYLPESDNDVRKFVLMTEHRINEITKALQPAIDYLNDKAVR